MQTSDNIFAVRFLRLPCLIDTKPPFLQLICCILNLLPQCHVAGKVAMLHPYCKRTASQKFCFNSWKPKSPIGSAVRQFDTPFSILKSSDLLDFCDRFFLIDLGWCGIDVAFLFL